MAVDYEKWGVVISSILSENAADKEAGVKAFQEIAVAATRSLVLGEACMEDEEEEDSGEENEEDFDHPADKKVEKDLEDVEKAVKKTKQAQKTDMAEDRKRAKECAEKK